MSYVYEHRCTVSGKSYIGKTSISVAKRWAKHVHSALNLGTDFPFHRAIRKYGRGAFETTILAGGISDAEALRIEREMIASRGTRAPYGYNATDGGEGPSGYVPSVEARARMRERALANKANCARLAAIGSNPTLETRAKMSAAAKRRYELSPPARFTDARRAKIAAALFGKRWDDARRQRASAARKGKTASEQTRAKMSVAHKLRCATLEVKARRAALAAQRPRTETGTFV